MYSSPSSSSQQQHSATTNSSSTNPNLMRYDSDPSSLLSNTVDSVLGHGHGNAHAHAQGHQFFSCVNNNNNNNNTNNNNKLSATSDESSTRNTLSLLHQGPFGNMDTSSKTTSSNGGLVRHSSSPAGLLSHLANYDIGYSGSKGFDVNYNNGQGSSMGEQHMLSRLGPQLSFTRKDHHSLSQISEVNESVLEDIEHERKRQSRSNNTSGFSLSSWDDSNNNNFIISTSNKRGKNVNDDILNGLSSLDPQQAMELEMATMDRLLHVPQDSVPCKIRAKRGCATHPRSIAERERRTRISAKLKKLQELVPNMDKQTSYADMLDLAVQHIKGLQGQIEKLNNELNNCTCGCKPKV